MAALKTVLEREATAGNYCIAGGDFNQTFPDVSGPLFALKRRNTFVPGILDATMLPAGYRFAADTTTPSSRLNDKPYTGDIASTQFYVIDGFILSNNVSLSSVKTLDLGFANSDHNPVLLTVTLKTIN
jgi:hypothetical protein